MDRRCGQQADFADWRQAIRVRIRCAHWTLNKFEGKQPGKLGDGFGNSSRFDLLPHVSQCVARPHLTAPANVLRISLHPRGLAPQIINLAQWRRYVLERLRRLLAASGDPVRADLLLELASYPLPAAAATIPVEDIPMADAAMLLRLRSPVGELAMFSTITVFGTPTEITLSESALEAFYPADAVTGERLRMLLS